MIEDIECVGPNFQAHVFGIGYPEGLLQRNIHLVEASSSSGVSAQIAIQERKIYDVTGERVDRTQTTGSAYYISATSARDNAGSQEGVLNGSALGSREAGRQCHTSGGGRLERSFGAGAEFSSRVVFHGPGKFQSRQH